MAYQVRLEQLSDRQRENLWELFALTAELKRRVTERRAAGMTPEDVRRMAGRV